MRTVFSFLLAVLLGASPGAAAAPTEAEINAINASRADYDRAKRAIDAMQWKEAIAALESAARKDPGNAEYQNLLGFSHRARGDMDAAFRHYFRALELDPSHRGAHEYLGRAYLMADQPQKAVEVLGKLDRLCGEPCREGDLLRRAIADYPWPAPGRTAGARAY